MATEVQSLHLTDLDNFDDEPTNCLGRGAFSSVFKMKISSTGQTVALKKIQRAKIRDPQLILNEKAILTTLHHPAIIQILGTDKDSSHLYFIFEYCGNGSLRRQIEVQVAGLELKVIQSWAMQTLLGLQYLHDVRNVVHGDIKPANLLLDQKWNIKIADFGFACHLADLNRSEREIGTKINWAPEQIQKYNFRRNVQLTEKIDIWAFGVTFYQLAFLDHPFRSSNEHELNRRIVDDEISFPCGASCDLVEMLTLALKKSTQDRYGASQLLELKVFECLTEDDIFSAGCVTLDDQNGDEYHCTQSLFEAF